MQDCSIFQNAVNQAFLIAPIPHFTVCKHPQQVGKCMVFFGAALMEIVDEDQDNPSFKLLLARLYNAQIKRKTLVESFGVALTTLRRWGVALSGDDPERLVRYRWSPPSAETHSGNSRFC